MGSKNTQEFPRNSFVYKELERTVPKNKVKIVFFGSSEFAVPSLKRIFESQHEVLAVVTQPDREKGRHLKIQATPVKIALPPGKAALYQPESLRDYSAEKFLNSFSADLFVVVSFGQILTANILKIPRVFSINLHPSLLPKYRGAAPVNWAVINGETKTGLTVIRMNERMDAGDMILQREIEIDQKDTAEILNKRLSELGAILLLDAIRLIDEGKAIFKKQDEKKATFAPRLKKEDGFIDWGKDSREIHNKVRGAAPWPGAYTYFDKKRINIWKADVLEGEASPGEIVETKNALIVGTKKGLLKLEELQLEGKKVLVASEFLRGLRGIEKGMKFGV